MGKMGKRGFTCVSLSVVTAAAREKGQDLCRQLEGVSQKEVRGQTKCFAIATLLKMKEYQLSQHED